MSDRTLIMALAKVIIAAAWADNELTNEEQNCLKDLLYKLPESHTTGNRHLNATEWARLEMYIEAPVGEGEREELVEDLKAALRTPEDRELALTYLDNLVRADGTITEEEKVVVAEIQTALESVNLNIFGQFARLLRGPVERRQSAISKAPNREQFFDDFVRNKVYFAVQQRLAHENRELNLPETKLRRLSAIGGLMARVAHVDQTVTDGEFDAMVKRLETDLQVSRDESLFIAQVAITAVSAEMDFVRLTRELASDITPSEGDQLLDLLFGVAEADGKVSHKEIEEIYNISFNLNLSHRQFIAAKTKIPAEKRDS